MAEYKSLCTKHVELELEIKTRLAAIEAHMQGHVKGLDDARERISDCLEDFSKSIEIFNRVTPVLATHGEKLKTGNRRFVVHMAMISGLYLAVGTLIIGLAATHPELKDFLLKAVRM